MTDEERRKLCAALRSPVFGQPPLASARKAADEIERLAATLEACRQEYEITDKERERLLSENRKLKREQVAQAMGWKDD